MNVIRSKIFFSCIFFIFFFGDINAEFRHEDKDDILVNVKDTAKLWFATKQVKLI